MFKDKADGWKITMKYFQNVVDTVRYEQRGGLKGGRKRGKKQGRNERKEREEGMEGRNGRNGMEGMEGTERKGGTGSRTAGMARIFHAVL